MITLIALVVLLQLVTIAVIQQQRGMFMKKQPETVVDTCTLIDGRILDLAKTGFLPAKLLVPEFVVEELQQMADGRNNDKRQRARFGLDIVSELQEMRKVDIAIIKDERSAHKEVDARLVDLAKARRASLFTIDYNLNKVAEIAGIEVLNVNELTKRIKPIVLPGEIVSIKLQQKGAGRGQAVGHLEDGTMVVVDKASKLIGKKVRVTIVRNLQTAAGRMAFAELAEK